MNIRKICHLGVLSFVLPGGMSIAAPEARAEFDSAAFGTAAAVELIAQHPCPSTSPFSKQAAKKWYRSFQKDEKTVLMGLYKVDHGLHNKVSSALRFKAAADKFFHDCAATFPKKGKGQ